MYIHRDPYGSGPMTQSPPDPAKWLKDLMTAKHAALWPPGPVAETSKAITAAAAPWTQAMAEFTKLQMDTLQQMTAPWAQLMPDVAASPEPVKDRRFASEAWSKDPRWAQLVRTYVANADLLRKTLDAPPLDERSKAQWSFPLCQGM